jgi:hypothetical protein
MFILMLHSYLLLIFLHVCFLRQLEKEILHAFFSCTNVTDILHRIDSHIK